MDVTGGLRMGCFFSDDSQCSDAGAVAAMSTLMESRDVDVILGGVSFTIVFVLSGLVSEMYGL